MLESVQLARVEIPDDPAIVLPILLVVGFVLLVTAFRLWMRVRRARSWRPVAARVEHAVVRSNPVDDDEDSPSPDVRYVFDIDGRRHYGNRPLLIGVWWLTPGRARELVRRLDGAERVIAYVNPQNPADNCLDRSGHGVAGWTAVVGLVFWLIALFVYAG